ncbi:DUF3788 domain-containing protein [Petroclostridium sp. X23]|uniref:DUF3788 domain-containing protein n=1 Tax=Petroclostridium sp. X23 TaxID=3045146 RepID=UPI0024AD5FB0|nr:DUF3788 domain-containing protein [Petroclostridium sp. X23]WHH57133.1 DUF3788 domain-containing protein [Petroclostridium sp. X23]
MSKMDLILDAGYVPEMDDLTEYINQPARELWIDLNMFIQQKYNARSKITYSKCSGKPGWNLKYQKSGKSICTLYPEKNRFIALVVITIDLLPYIEGISYEFEAGVRETIKNAKPFNGTLWLMLAIENTAILENVKQLLIIKQPAQKSGKQKIRSDG